MSKFRTAFESFISDRERLEMAIISSTKANWAGSGYKLELFEDGSFRVLRGSLIGNKYRSPGVLLPVPFLSDDEFDEEHGHFFENAIDELRDVAEEVLSSEETS